MPGVLTGFATIWAVTALGYLVGRWGLLGPQSAEVLARLAFYVATPALLFVTLAGASPGDVLTPALAAFVASTVAVAAAYALVARLWWRRDAGQVTVGTLSASYVNAGNLGIPIAAYVLGDVSFIAPVLLFQVLLAAPVALAVLDITTTGRRPSPRRLLLLPLRNPVMLASALGLLVSAVGWRPPAALLAPVELVGSAAVPLALIALGVSLPGSKPFAPADDTRDRYLAVALKVVVQPLLAYLVGRFALGLSGPALLAAVVTSALPTAQNVFVFATRYRQATALARDTVVLSTIVAAVTMALVAAWLA
ncbi:AEC family transporter [Polymorphospora rubra]|uniref:Membrane protein n=1 Tax=Polymorphospora rubra TaxID=338584 RepID=A0A810N9X1_9ACTN|nr:AEC family transporter [Polymorphospora rubra]BCJ69870.1 membrane protein [Polymorphospora rubra]